MDDLKLLAQSLILESDFENKNYLLKFIGESSSDEDIKSFILDGSPIRLNEDDAKHIVNKRFDNLIENIIEILEQEPVPRPQPKQPNALLNPGNLMYAFMLPPDMQAGILAKIKMILSAGGGIVGGATLASLLGYISYKFYQNYLSKAAKECKDSPDKSECMRQYKIKAVNAQIQKLNGSIRQCEKSKNPDKCKLSLQNKINKLRNKMGKI